MLPTFANANPEPLFEEKPEVIVVEVNKKGGSITNLFNLYGAVETIYTHGQYAIEARLNCSGQGFIRCRLDPNIPPTLSQGSIGVGSNNFAISGELNSRESIAFLQNPAVIRTINELIDLSESKTATKGVNKGTASKKVAISEGKSTEMFFFNAEWNYDAKREGKMRIAISLAPTNLISTRK